jgi:Xaa-Pro aminopeptidase
MPELETKLEKMRSLLEQNALDALLLQRSDSFAWATCGAASHVNSASTYGAASLLVTRSERYLITDNIEAPRLEQEEQLRAQGWEFRVSPWYEANTAIQELTKGRRFGADTAYPGATDLSQALVHLRAALTPEEGTRFRELGRRCADAMNAAARAVHPGMSEEQIASDLAREAWSRGVEPTVNLIATDERIFRIRHPLPTAKSMKQYAMLVMCGRKWGLVCSITRLVHFGHLPDEVRRKAEAVAYIDACFIAGTRPGRKLREIFAEATQIYELRGFPGEWKMHHQGGPVGYQPREIVVTPSTEGEVAVGQAYAWNPSIQGAKSEDTILVGEHTNQILTETKNWPMVEFQIGDQAIKRPAILEQQ